MDIKALANRQLILRVMGEHDSLGASVFGHKYAFKKRSTLLIQGHEAGVYYDAGAVFCAAHAHQYPEKASLTRNDCMPHLLLFAEMLQSIGFVVIDGGSGWSASENEATVACYFSMLALEAANEPYNKKQHNRELQPKLLGRSLASIEFKHQNISAILVEAGLPYVQGYKPAIHYQDGLRDAVLRHISQNLRQVLDIGDLVDQRVMPGHKRYKGVLVDPPRMEMLAQPDRRLRVAKKIDFSARDQRNRLLGRNGEDWVLGYERQRLNEAARHELADSIRWVAEVDGDGAGYDIRSYETNGSERFIEVKTTSGGIATPFMLSSNEVDFSDEYPQQFFLYRVFNFVRDPHLYILNGSLRNLLHLEAVEYRARVKALAEQ